MKAFDLHRMAFDKVPFDFLGEVALRGLYLCTGFFVPQNDRKTRSAADRYLKC